MKIRKSCISAEHATVIPKRTTTRLLWG